MKYIVIFYLSIFSPVLLLSQNDISKNNDSAKANSNTDDIKLVPGGELDTLVTSTGFKVYPGQDLRLGVGTMPNGSFKYINTERNNWASFLSRRPNNIHVGSKWSGQYFTVKKIQRYCTSKKEYNYLLILGGDNIINYECDLEMAIKCGEIVVPEQYQPKSMQSVVTFQNNVSVDDELKKLKKLYESGALTKTQYKRQKNKLLNQ